MHRADCPNVAYMTRNAGAHAAKRTWIGKTEITHAVDIEVEAIDRPQLLQDVMAVFAELKTQVSSVTARVKRDRHALVEPDGADPRSRSSAPDSAQAARRSKTSAASIASPSAKPSHRQLFELDAVLLIRAALAGRSN